MKYHWLAVAVALAVLVAGCKTSSQHGTSISQTADRFNIQAVYSECRRLDCAEPNMIVARHFAEIAQQAGSACIVHVVPEYGEIPWRYWDDYVQPLHDLLARSQLHLYVHAPSGNRRSVGVKQASQELGRIEALYARHGAAYKLVTRKVIGEESAVVPPYREPYCNGRPLLEIMEGARLVSPAASSAAERATAKEMAPRTVLVVVDALEKR